MKHFYLAALLLICTLAHALNFTPGIYYFDNSQTRWTSVQFVYGNSSWTMALNMASDDGNTFYVSINTTITDVDRYCFAASALPTDRLLSSSFTTIKDSLSNTLLIPRTTTSDVAFSDQDIYVPERNISSQWVEASWHNYADWVCAQNPADCMGGSDGDDSFVPSASISGTLPVIYVNTTGGAPITSKEEYINATCYIDSMSNPAFRSNGSVDSPLAMQIRGRGNWTWNGFDKKPYKIKLNAGEKLLGLHKSKHWALIAAADDNLGFLRNTVGFFLSRRIGLRWTPTQVPVELVLNGQYEGLYFLTETIRIDNHRVDIQQQDDGSLLYDELTGGWLVEIDNYSSEGNITLTESNGQSIMFTLHDPEVLSTPQRNYVTSQLNALNTAIGDVSSSDMDRLLDLDEAVKYYLVQELMEDCESYHGSCYLYKDRDADGAAAKWFFGPVWDFGNSFNRHLYGGENNARQFIYQNPEFAQYWIGTIAEHQSFQTLLRKYWYLFYNVQQDDIYDLIDEFVEQIRYAAQNDALRWQSSSNVQTNVNVEQKKHQFLEYFRFHVQWLNQVLDGGTPGLEDNPDWTGVEQPAADELVGTTPVKFFRDGELLIYHDGHIYNALGLLVE